MYTAGTATAGTATAVLAISVMSCHDVAINGWTYGNYPDKGPSSALLATDATNYCQSYESEEHRAHMISIPSCL